MDRKKGKRWQFRGLRGPVEASLVTYAAAPEDPERAIETVRPYAEAGATWWIEAMWEAGSLERATDNLAAWLEAHPEAAIVGPRLVDDRGEPELSFGPMISPLGELRQKVVTGLHARGVPLASSWVRRVTSREHRVDWVSGACLLVRRAVAEQVGLLDERFFLYTEDVDFCASVRAAGWKVLFTPAAEIVHLRGRSRATAPRQMNAAYRRSHLAFYEKHHPRWVRWLEVYLRVKRQMPPPNR